MAQGQEQELHRLAKSREANKHESVMTSPGIEPALSVVVYREPGPDDGQIEAHARTIVENRSPSTGAGLGYVTFVESDFDRLWGGVDRGDAYGTAYAVLMFLGPKAEQFIGRNEDFLFGWIGGADDQYGNVLLLQIIPKPHLLAGMN